MSCTEKRIQVGDYGTQIQLCFEELNAAGAVVPLPITTTTARLIVLKRPDGTVLRQNPLPFDTDGSDGKASYFTKPGDINQAGDWEAQGVVRFPADANNPQGRVFNSRISRFPVDRNLEDVEDPMELRQLPETVELELGVPEPQVTTP